jgi:taurine--2-oxoglutarate transaminase
VSEVKWEQLLEWDKKYHLHIRYAINEYTPLPIARAEGVYLITPDGKKILDFIAGLLSVNCGHNNPEIKEEIRKALEDYDYVWEAFVTRWRPEACKLIIEDLLGPDKWAARVRFPPTGSEANEEAFMISRLYTRRPIIIVRELGYHGWTEGAGSATRVAPWRGYLTSPKTDELIDIPSFGEAHYQVIPAPYCYRCPLGHEYPDCKENGHVPCGLLVKEMIETLGPDKVAAIITDCVTSAAVVASPKEFLEDVRRITEEYGVVWIDDEVVCGFGRLGAWFGYQALGLRPPDIMTMAKGISGCYLPIAGVVVNKKIASFMEEYRWWHAVTHAANPIALAAVVATIKVMQRHKLVERAARVGEYIGKRLKELEEKHKSIGYVTGRGLLWGIEFVRDKKTKKPFVEPKYLGAGDVSRYPCNFIMYKALEKGVLVSGFMANTLRIGPPLTITEEEVDKAIEAIDYAVGELEKTM